MKLTERYELVFVTAELTHRGTTIEIPDVLIDTGAASTVVDAEPPPRASERVRVLLCTHLCAYSSALM